MSKVRCLTCSYILKGLAEHRCPECGRTFDPGDPTTYVTAMRCGRALLVQTVLLVVAMIAPLFLAVLADMGRLNFPNPGRRYSAFYWIVIVLVSGTSYVINKRRTATAGRTLLWEPGAIVHQRFFRTAYAIGYFGVFLPFVFLFAILVAMIVLAVFGTP